MSGTEANFVVAVKQFIRQIPIGKVATYGQIAALAGSPRSARLVGQILRQSSEKDRLPWQRVVDKNGYITIVNFAYPAELQANLLRQEGIQLKREKDLYQITDFGRFLWQPDLTN